MAGRRVIGELAREWRNEVKDTPRGAGASSAKSAKAAAGDGGPPGRVRPGRPRAFLNEDGRSRSEAEKRRMPPATESRGGILAERGCGTTAIVQAALG